MHFFGLYQFCFLHFLLLNQVLFTQFILHLLQAHFVQCDPSLLSCHVNYTGRQIKLSRQLLRRQIQASRLSIDQRLGDLFSVCLIAPIMLQFYMQI